MRAGAWPDARSTLTSSHGNVGAIRVPGGVCHLHKAPLACWPAEAAVRTEGRWLVFSHLFLPTAEPGRGLLAAGAARAGTHRLPDMLRGSVGLITGGGESHSLLVPIFFPLFLPTPSARRPKRKPDYPGNVSCRIRGRTCSLPMRTVHFFSELGIGVKEKHYISFN